jgi:hypothetical protein
MGRVGLMLRPPAEIVLISTKLIQQTANGRAAAQLPNHERF